MRFNKSRHDDFVAGIDHASFHGNLDVRSNRSNFAVAKDDRAILDRLTGHRNDFRPLERKRFLRLQVRSHCQSDNSNSSQEVCLIEHDCFPFGFLWFYHSRWSYH